jgi:hypothetical protein
MTETDKLFVRFCQHKYFEYCDEKRDNKEQDQKKNYTAYVAGNYEFLIEEFEKDNGSISRIHT